MLRLLAILAAILVILYLVITWLSHQFTLDGALENRPIVEVLILLAAAFLIYLVSIGVATKAKQDAKLIVLIVTSSILFRIIVLFSLPIQEVDLYRYIWDGVVSSQGISPFQYPPDQVELAAKELARNETISDPELRQLARLVNQSPVISKVLEEVHYGELPTVYPPTSQAIFYCVASTTPSHASLLTRIRILKGWLILFDLGVLLLVIQLLRLVQMPVGLSVVYGWCPLVLKEIAGSGHLDSLAVFLTTGAIVLMIRLIQKSPPVADVGRRRTRTFLLSFLTALLLALAVGAKIYPLVLAPLFFLTSLKRLGWQATSWATLVFLASTAVLLWPLLPTSFRNPSSEKTTVAIPQTSATESLKTDPSTGIATFLKHWEMNDLIFMIVVENLKPDDTFLENKRVWFSVVPAALRSPIIESISQTLHIPKRDVPFLTARCLTAVLFLSIAAWLAWRSINIGSTRSFLEASFLTLAWFWLLCPTQNPWYWLWALPLLPFCRNRAWYAISGLVLIYYIRFWFDYHCSETQLLGTGYVGTDFFDYVVAWIEFGPWFLWLAISSAGKRQNLSVTDMR